jgi:uncharacterized membrane protein YccC
LDRNEFTKGLQLAGRASFAALSLAIAEFLKLAHGADPWRYAFFRFVETVLGIVVAWLSSFAPKLLRIDEPLRREGR